MNKILHLFDEAYVLDYLKKKVLPLYPNFVEIESIKITPYKNHVWEKTYHVVLEFETCFKDKDGSSHKLPIFCSAHSDEPRKNVYTSLKYLWEKGFESGPLSIPHALFYDAYFSATFYRGVEGNHLYYFIRDNNREKIEEIIPKAAKWFAKLHSIDTSDAKNFNKDNSRLRTVNPGVKHILDRMSWNYPDYLEFYKNVYDIFINAEEDFLRSTNERWLVHGDAHPENIIRMSERKIAAIDFTDLCLADFSRDLGSFCQQLEYMMDRKINDKEYREKMVKLFLENYFASIDFASYDDELKKRIEIYYYWTSVRTATHFLLKDKPEPQRAKTLIDVIKSNYNL